MSNWFDGLAKRSARSEVSDATGLTRRQVLARGAVVTGVAWTAPMLLTAQPAWAAISCPKPNEVSRTCPDGKEFCCPSTERCFIGANGKPICEPGVGDPCGNNGFGTCAGGASTCNQICNTNEIAICGGAGSTCGQNSDCAGTRKCNKTTTGGFCGGVLAVCVTDADCSPGTCANNNIRTKCTGIAANGTKFCQAF